MTLGNADLARLRPGEFLNDNLVDFYLKYVQHNRMRPEDCHRCVFFNCFFWRKLVGEDASHWGRGPADHKKARRTAPAGGATSARRRRLRCAAAALFREGGRAFSGGLRPCLSTLPHPPHRAGARGAEAGAAVDEGSAAVWRQHRLPGGAHQPEPPLDGGHHLPPAARAAAPHARSRSRVRSDPIRSDLGRLRPGLGSPTPTPATARPQAGGERPGAAAAPQLAGRAAAAGAAGTLPLQLRARHLVCAAGPAALPGHEAACRGAPPRTPQVENALRAWMAAEWSDRSERQQVISRVPIEDALALFASGPGEGMSCPKARQGARRGRRSAPPPPPGPVVQRATRDGLRRPGRRCPCRSRTTSRTADSSSARSARCRRLRPCSSAAWPGLLQALSTPEP